MANEPERPIEKLLRAFARKRGDEAGAPFDLHPATRKLLQGEVTRKFGKPAPKDGSLFGSLSRLWPRIAWAAAIFGILGLVVWMIVPRSGEVANRARLAFNEPPPVPAGEPGATTLAAPAASTAPAPGFAGGVLSSP